ncbi:MAG: M1 family metallopeptidase [Terriglobales bacterium]
MITKTSIVALLLLCAPSAFAAPPAGIPRELARQRAATISDVRYHLLFTLAPHAPTTAAHEELTFTLKSPQAVLLDYRDGQLGTVTVNGATLSAHIDNGHIEIPADRLHAGDNKVVLDFTSNIAPAGKAFTRFDDRDDGSEYIYTLLVPMDASMAFPCFDQPDIKARFTLQVVAPTDWTVISNGKPAWRVGTSNAATNGFAETPPISTYLFAFAAGPFRAIEAKGSSTLYVRKVQYQRALSEAPEVQEITARGIRYLEDFFAQPFPFPKYDQVLIPGFPYGGMEHAGATFLREESVLFRTAPTHTDLLNRDALVLHELTHQWFGDLTTMRWFDDLWLKEGFAQYMAYQALAALKPEEPIWKRFYETIKPAAYAIDVTKGTTPIYQDIPNLKDAKSAYGAIVYSKAPGVLKQLAFVLGPEHFRDGLRLYLKEHLYANAEWSDLVHSFERVSGRSLSDWAEMWIRRRGMPQVDVEWACGPIGGVGGNEHPTMPEQGYRITKFTVTQHDVLNEGGVWPIATKVLLHYPTMNARDLRVEFGSRQAVINAAINQPCPDYVFANDEDEAYGRFLPDQYSRPTILNEIGKEPDLFRRTLLWGSLWESVRVADLAPRRYIALAQKLLPGETDESLTASIVGRTASALHDWVSDKARRQFVPGFESLAVDKMLHASNQGLRIIWFRGLRAFAETPDGLARLKQLLDGRLSVPGVELRPLDRWNLVATLVAMNDPQAGAVFDAERQRDQTGDGRKYAYMAEAARPDPATKKKYFDDYLHDPSRPEDWVEISLGAFNWWNQSQLTAPYLRPALDALPQVKRERKIFFLLAWLNAFIGGQQSEASDQQVYDFLRTAKPEKDLELKILQVVDDLDRTVKIRKKFPQ